MVALRSKPHLTYPVAPAQKLPLLLPLYLLAPVTVEIYRRYGDSGSWSGYGIAWNRLFIGTMVVGFGVGVLGVALLLAVQLGLGWRRWCSDPAAAEAIPEDSAAARGTQPNLLLLTLALLPLTLFIGWVEELVFRGVLVNGLLEALPVGAVVILASLVFAVSHLVWDGLAGMPQLPGLGLMGAVLILARWAMGGSLGLAWGLHAGWIFAIALLDGAAVIQPVELAPTWLAGKPDQPLTGVATLLLLGLTGAGIWAYRLASG